MPSVKVKDIDIFYELHGEGEPLVLITGLGNDVTQYDHIIRELLQHYRVLAFDNRGAGRTDMPEAPYTVGQMADDAAALMNALGIGQAHIVGISMGGRVALALALQHPGLVKSLVLVSTFARQIMVSENGRASPMPQYREGVSKYPQPRHAFERQLVASRSYDCGDRLGAINVPTLILHGTSDRLVSPGLAEEIHAGIKGSKMITFAGGHLFFMTMPGQFCRTVSDFLYGTVR
jgi:pimeloyl-ACP methyl ester carboxylesterase